eukprot:6301086-Amphidinium_carterae.1
MSAKHQFVRFSPQCRHAVDPSSGLRLSIVYFNPRFLSKLSTTLCSQLETLGFQVHRVLDMQRSFGCSATLEVKGRDGDSDTSSASEQNDSFSTWFQDD